jgi:hypothetical protein
MPQIAVDALAVGMPDRCFAPRAELEHGPLEALIALRARSVSTLVDRALLLLGQVLPARASLEVPAGIVGLDSPAPTARPIGHGQPFDGDLDVYLRLADLDGEPGEVFAGAHLPPRHAHRVKLLLGAIGEHHVDMGVLGIEAEPLALVDAHAL